MKRTHLSAVAAGGWLDRLWRKAPGVGDAARRTPRPTPAPASLCQARLEAGRQSQLGAAAEGAQPVRPERLHPHELSRRPNMIKAFSVVCRTGAGVAGAVAVAQTAPAPAAAPAGRACGHARHPEPEHLGCQARRQRRSPATPSRPMASAPRCSPATTRRCGARWARA